MKQTFIFIGIIIIIDCGLIAHFIEPDDDVLSFLTSDEEPLPTVTSNVTRTTNRATQSPTASRSSGRGRGRARSAVAPVTRTPRIHVEPNPPMPDCSQDEEMARILQEQMNEPLVEDDPIFFSDDDDLIPQFVMPSMLPQRSRIQPLPAFGTEHPFYPNATSPLPPHLQSILPVLDPFTAIEAQLLDPSGPSRSRRRLPRYSNNRIPTHLRAIAEDEDADYESLLALDELTEPVNRGASTDQLQSLPTRTYVTGSMKREEASCGICLTEYEQGDKLKSLPRCLHSFHSPCIDKWLSINKICPVCRADIN